MSSSRVASTAIQYDAKGNLTGTVDGEGNRNAYIYDVIDRLTAFTDGRGNDTVYEYDELSRLLSHTTPEGNKTEYRYDAISRMTKAKDPNGLITEYQYDVMGNLVEEISRKGARTAYTYDPVHRLTSITTPLGLKRGLTYDVADTYSYGNEHLTNERFAEWNGYYTYDPRGSVTGVTDSKGMIWQSYRYNANGDMTFGKPQYNNVYSYNAESYNPNMESQYLRARYYNVIHGNFLTEDSYLGNIIDPLMLNRYNYELEVRDRNKVENDNPEREKIFHIPWKI